MKKHWILLLIIILSALTYFFIQNDLLKNEPINLKNTILKNLNLQKEPLQKIVSNSVSSDSSLTESKENKITDEQLNLWLQKEVKNIELPVTDPISAEQKTKNLVNQLSQPQIKILMQKVLDNELAMNERIFANYSLTLYSGENANQNLYELINSKMPDYKNVQVHSEDEVKRAQDYALRYTQIDALAMNAENGDHVALTLLTQIVNNGTDGKIQNYAKRKLKEISKQ